MTPYYEEAGIEIYDSDCRSLLAGLDSDSIDCCVTSPPYWGLRDYGIEPSVWGGSPECGHEWGDPIEVNATNHTDKRRWNHTRNGRDEEQPIEKRVAWLRTTVEQGAYCIHCGAWRGSLGLEPTPQLYIEHMVSIFEEVRRVLKPEGTCWINIGDSYTSGNRDWRAPDKWNPARAMSTRALTPPGLKPKDLCLIPFRLAIALQEADWYVRSDIIWSKPNPMPESCKDRPTKSHEYVFLLAKAERYHFDADAVRESDAGTDHARTILHRPEPSGGILPPHNGIRQADGRNGLGRNIRSVWTIPTQPFPDAHFAVYPEKLIEPCIKAGCPEGGIVIDPFTGAGTTAVVARRLGCRFMGAEMNTEYIEIAAKRLSQGVLAL